MKNIVFHGTSIQNARKILKEGFQPKKRNWRISESVAYFYKNDNNHRLVFEKALIQGGSAAFKNVAECRRAVIALELDDKEIVNDATNSAGPYAFQYNGKSVPLDRIVGCWHDVHNLQIIRPFMLYNSRHQIHRVHSPKLVEELSPFFKQITEIVSVPIIQMFSKVNLDFDPTKEKFIL